MVYEFEVTTRQNMEFVDITHKANEMVSKSGMENGVCFIFVPHTTAAVTINENADPDVVFDMLKELNKIVPIEDQYRHMEGNSAAHIKASLMGFSEQVIVHNRKLKLGTWQGIYFAEFDGPRRRKVYVKVLKG